MIGARTVIVGMTLLISASLAMAQGTATMWYMGPFEGEVTIKDGQTQGRPGYYYHPQPTETPTFAERLERPVRCTTCGLWRDLGATCVRCGQAADRYEQSQARRGAIYTPRALPGQYWFEQPRPVTTGPKQRIGWPFIR